MLQDKKNILALIPARAGSKGLPDKNLKQLGGHPLLAWSVRACISSNFINRIIVSTDSHEYASAAINYGAEVPFLRPTAISKDNSTDLEFIKHALNALQELDSYIPEFVIHVRPTTPIRNPRTIDTAIEEFSLNEEKYTSLRSVHEMSESAYKTFEIKEGQLVTAFFGEKDLELANHPRQEMPLTFTPNGYVDVISTRYLSSTGKIHGDKVFPYLTEQVIEVDSAWDFKMLELQVQNSPELITRVFGVN